HGPRETASNRPDRLPPPRDSRAALTRRQRAAWARSAIARERIPLQQDERRVPRLLRRIPLLRCSLRLSVDHSLLEGAADREPGTTQSTDMKGVAGRRCARVRRQSGTSALQAFRSLILGSVAVAARELCRGTAMRWSAQRHREAVLQVIEACEQGPQPFFAPV